MRVALQDAAVHERAGVALVGVTEYVLGCGTLPCRRFPLQSRGKTAAAAAAQAALLDRLYYRLGCPVGEYRHQPLVATGGQGAGDLRGVHRAAVAQDDACLRLKEVHVVNDRSDRLTGAVAVEESGNRGAADDVSFHDLICIFGVDALVEDAFRFNHHDRSCRAGPHATRRLDRKFYAAPLRRLRERFGKFTRSRGEASAALAHANGAGGPGVLPSGAQRRREMLKRLFIDKRAHDASSSVSLPWRNWSRIWPT